MMDEIIKLIATMLTIHAISLTIVASFIYLPMLYRTIRRKMKATRFFRS